MPLKYSYRLYHLIGRIQRISEKIGTYLDVDKFQKVAAHGALIGSMCFLGCIHSSSDSNIGVFLANSNPSINSRIYHRE